MHRWGKFREKNFGFIKRKSAVSYCLTAPCFRWASASFLPHIGTFVPRAGVEPARVAPLVFETSASTDSAIWACHLAADSQTKAGAKGIQKTEMPKVFDKKLKNTCSYHRN